MTKPNRRWEAEMEDYRREMVSARFWDGVLIGTAVVWLITAVGLIGWLIL